MQLVLAAIHIEPSPRAVPLGPAMLASALKRAFPNEIQTCILDLFLEQPAVACAEKILESNPDCVGLSLFVWNRTLSLEIAAILKARKSGIVLFAGGAEATADQAGVLADGSIDFVLPGEGEELILEAMGRLLQGATPREIAAAVKPGPVRNLATLASPYLDGTLRLQEYTGALWELSRGCPFKCDFCFESRGTAGIRRIPMDRVEAELAAFESSGIREVFVLDPTFNYHKAQAKQILRLIAKKAPDIHFFFEIRSEFIDREMAKLFAAIHCTLQIGLQSAHDEVLRNISRSIDPKAFEAKLLLLHQAGVPYGFDLIFGLPGDSLEGFRTSLDFALSLVPNHLDIFRLAVLPGTRLAETAPNLGLQYQAGNPYHVLGSPTFSPVDMAKAARIAQGCDVFYNQGKAVPWFDIILEALQMTPSQVLEAFATFMEKAPAEDLTLIQRNFIVALFDDRGDALIGSIAADIISYFGYSAELLDSPIVATDSPGHQEPPARLVGFNHDPVDMLAQMQAGTTNLEDLVCSLPPRFCEAFLCLHGGDVDIRLAPHTKLRSTR